MTVRNRFVRGSGLYQCRCCGRKTRSTGNGDNEHIQLCVDCYDLAGYDNAVQNGEALTASEKSDVHNLVAHLVTLGADVSNWKSLVENAKA